MDTRQERLSRLDNALLNKQQICSSEGVLSSFPTVLKEPFMIDGVDKEALLLSLTRNHFLLKPATHSFSRKTPCFRYYIHPLM